MARGQGRWTPAFPRKGLHPRAPQGAAPKSAHCGLLLSSSDQAGCAKDQGDVSPDDGLTRRGESESAVAQVQLNSSAAAITTGHGFSRGSGGRVPGQAPSEPEDATLQRIALQRHAIPFTASAPTQHTGAYSKSTYLVRLPGSAVQAQHREAYSSMWHIIIASQQDAAAQAQRRRSALQLCRCLAHSVHAGRSCAQTGQHRLYPSVALSKHAERGVHHVVQIFCLAAC